MDKKTTDSQLGIQREAFEIRLMENNEKLKKAYEDMLLKSIKEQSEVIDARTKAMREQIEKQRMAERAQGVVHAENTSSVDTF